MPRDDFEEFDGQPIDPHSAELQRALVAFSREQDDEDDLSPDLDDSRALDVVRERDGRELLSEATDPAREAREIAARQQDDRDEPEQPVAEKPAEQPQAPALPDDTDKLLAALPSAHRPAVKALAQRAASWAEIEEIAAPFAADLKQNGQTIADGVRALAQNHRFATTSPGEYMAWFTSKMVPEQHRAQALIQVGKALGVNLVEDEYGLDDEDGKKPEPVDVDARYQQATTDALLATFEAATGPDGKPAHPLFSSSHPLSAAVHRAMTAEIQKDVAAGGKPPATVAQLRPYYTKAVGALTAALPITDAKEKVEKAKRASSPIGTAAAAPRQAPATPRPTPRASDGSDELLQGLKALFPTTGDE